MTKRCGSEEAEKMKRISLLFCTGIACFGGLCLAQETVPPLPENSASEVIHDAEPQEEESPAPEHFSPAPETETDPILRAYADSVTDSGEIKSEEAKKYARKKTVPSPLRPKKQSASGEHLDRSESYEEESRGVFKYGLEEQIVSLIGSLEKNGDTRFADEIYDLFQETKSPAVRETVLGYFAKLKDPCLGSYAVEVINDPYDYKKSIVDKCFSYVSETGIKEAVPGLVDLVDKEDDAYFSGALSALGELGEAEEALFLADYLDRSDLTVSQRQSLMRVLGRIKASQTWEKVSAIAQNEDENTFVRMYAAEAIGAMGVPESEDILAKLFESPDANLRVYAVKGISYFSDPAADAVIVQALRDSQYKVRLEAVGAVEKRDMKEAVPYLIFRCKDKNEQKAVKEKCYGVLAKLNDSEGNSYLVSILKDKKAGDAAKVKVAQALLEHNHAGTDEAIELAHASLESDARKNLRYALGKEFAKYGRPEFAGICAEYLAHDDVATQGTGLDIWAKGRYAASRSAVEEIAGDEEEAEPDESEKPKLYQFGAKKKNANAQKARRILRQSAE